MSTPQQWLRTPVAAMALGCSQNHLKRCRDTHGGFLVGGEHYILGTSHSAAILWNVERIRAAFHHRGVIRQRGEAMLKQAVGA
ncbi:hypothetical protein KBY70_11660 [Cyanobium sp. ATX 6E8]|uniref:hypothetical protein n=1 Tax=Cyanobium sp. ATX 6E8 TaxID=2823701 RepID=UPI0020CD388A|nr:hypothetical protein [Cyanobium sp. ATX 6E8]MCP9943046.1 hypothetical protein [Cyanobium sp. ATX 6E8]